MGATTLSSNNQRKPVSLNALVGTAIVIWVGTFASVYGPFVFGYVAMHAATTGVFLLAVRRCDRREECGTAEPTRAAATALKQPVSERRTRPQPVA